MANPLQKHPDPGLGDYLSAVEAVISDLRNRHVVARI